MRGGERGGTRGRWEVEGQKKSGPGKEQRAMVHIDHVHHDGRRAWAGLAISIKPFIYCPPLTCSLLVASQFLSQRRMHMAPRSSQAGQLYLAPRLDAAPHYTTVDCVTPRRPGRMHTLHAAHTHMRAHEHRTQQCKKTQNKANRRQGDKGLARGARAAGRAHGSVCCM